MSRILAYTSPARGHLYPLVPILDELQRRGHEIAVRTLASQVPMLNERGFAAGPLDARVEAIVLQDWRSRNQRRSLALSVAGFCARAEHDERDLREAIAQENPDAVLVDVNSWGALAAAERWGGPWACLCPYPLALRSDDVPPFGPGLPPARGPVGRLRDRMARPLVLRTVRAAMLDPLNLVRAGAGLPSLRAVDELFQTPPLTLYLTAEPFEYPRSDWPESVVMVGPCTWEPPVPQPAWLQALEGPVVLVTTSSEFQDDGRLVQIAMRALADEPVQVIATVPAGNPGDYEIAANAHVPRFLPHQAVLDKAVCAITHGGMGATQKALARGVPVCAVPFGRDQLEVARRVQVAGAGTRLSARRLSPRRLRDSTRRAIELAPGAGRVAAGYRAAGGPVAAADAVESRLLRTPTAGPSLPVST